MTLHIKKIMDGMLIFTILDYEFGDRSSESFYNQVKKLVRKGYINILVDFTNVKTTYKDVVEKVYEVHKLINACDGTMKIFGVSPEVASIISESKFSSYLNYQPNEVIDVDIFDLCGRSQLISLAS